jgi:cellulose synthase (UDP-forming)
VFLFAPAMYLLCGLQIYNASVPQFFAYGLPQLIAAILTTDYLFGQYRWTLISEVYELMQAMFSLRGVVSVLLRPRSPTFNVTPKGEQQDKDEISELAGPFYAVYLVVLFAALVGVWKLVNHYPARDVIISALCWSALNLILLNACIGVLYERRQRRVTPRVPTDLAASLDISTEDACAASATPDISTGDACAASATPDGSLAGRIVDLSSGGVRLVVQQEAQARLTRHEPAVLTVFNAALGRSSAIQVMVRSIFPRDDGTLSVGLEFVDRSVEGLSERVSLVYGDSKRWRDFRESRNRQVGILRSLGIVIRLGTVHAFSHYRSFFAGLLHCLHRLSAFASQRVRSVFLALK